MELIMSLISLFLVGYIGFLAINRIQFLKGFLQSDSNIPYFFQKYFWIKSCQNKDIQRRFMFTLLIVALYKLGSLILIPGISRESLNEFYKLIEGSSGLVPFLYEGNVSRYSIFCFGITPYLFGCGALLFFSMIIKPLRKLLFSEQEGRSKIVFLSVLLSFIFASLQYFYWILQLENPAVFMGISVVSESGIIFRVIAVLSLMAGFLILLWFSDLINKKGLGNGVAILVFSDVVVALFGSIKNSFEQLSSSNYQPFYYLLYALFLMISLILAIFVTNWQRRIKYKIEDKESVLSLRLSWFARAPITLAQTIVLLPATLASFFSAQWIQGFAGDISRGGFIYYFMYGVLIYFSICIYKAIVSDNNYFLGLFYKICG